MNVVREMFLCPLDLDWNMKELERGIYKKVREKWWREHDRGQAVMLKGIREVATW